MREAAALPLVGISALECRQRAGLTVGQTTLVQGSAGGAGLDVVFATVVLRN